MSEKIVQLNEEIIKGQLKELVRGSVEETLNELLEKEAASLTQAARYERSEARQGYRSGHYDRCLTTTSGDVTLHISYVPAPPAQTAADRSAGPSRGRQRSGLSEYKAWRSPPLGIRKAQAFLPALFMKLFSYFGAEPVRMTGTCLTFLPTVRRSSAKTISGVRSK